MVIDSNTKVFAKKVDKQLDDITCQFMIGEAQTTNKKSKKNIDQINFHWNDDKSNNNYSSKPHSTLLSFDNSFRTTYNIQNLHSNTNMAQYIVKNNIKFNETKKILNRYLVDHDVINLHANKNTENQDAYEIVENNIESKTNKANKLVIGLLTQNYNTGINLNIKSANGTTADNTLHEFKNRQHISSTIDTRFNKYVSKLNIEYNHQKNSQKNNEGVDKFNRSFRIDDLKTKNYRMQKKQNSNSYTINNNNTIFVNKLSTVTNTNNDSVNYETIARSNKKDFSNITNCTEESSLNNVPAVAKTRIELGINDDNYENPSDAKSQFTNSFSNYHTKFTNKTSSQYDFKEKNKLLKLKLKIAPKNLVPANEKKYEIDTIVTKKEDARNLVSTLLDKTIPINKQQADYSNNNDSKLVCENDKNSIPKELMKDPKNMNGFDTNHNNCSAKLVEIINLNVNADIQNPNIAWFQNKSKYQNIDIDKSNGNRIREYNNIPKIKTINECVHASKDNNCNNLSPTMCNDDLTKNDTTFDASIKLINNDKLHTINQLTKYKINMSDEIEIVKCKLITNSYNNLKNNGRFNMLSSNNNDSYTTNSKQNFSKYNNPNISSGSEKLAKSSNTVSTNEPYSIRKVIKQFNKDKIIQKTNDSENMNESIQMKKHDSYDVKFAKDIDQNIDKLSLSNDSSSVNKKFIETVHEQDVMKSTANINSIFNASTNMNELTKANNLLSSNISSIYINKNLVKTSDGNAPVIKKFDNLRKVISNQSDFNSKSDEINNVFLSIDQLNHIDLSYEHKLNKINDECCAYIDLSKQNEPYDEQSTTFKTFLAMKVLTILKKQLSKNDQIYTGLLSNGMGDSVLNSDSLDTFKIALLIIEFWASSVDKLYLELHISSNKNFKLKAITNQECADILCKVSFVCEDNYNIFEFQVEDAVDALSELATNEILQEYEPLHRAQIINLYNSLSRIRIPALILHLKQKTRYGLIENTFRYTDAQLYDVNIDFNRKLYNALDALRNASNMLDLTIDNSICLDFNENNKMISYIFNNSYLDTIDINELSSYINMLQTNTSEVIAFYKKYNDEMVRYVSTVFNNIRAILINSKIGVVPTEDMCNYSIPNVIFCLVNNIIPVSIGNNGYVHSNIRKVDNFYVPTKIPDKEILSNLGFTIILPSIAIGNQNNINNLPLDLIELKLGKACCNCGTCDSCCIKPDYIKVEVYPNHLGRRINKKFSIYGETLINSAQP